MIGQPLQNVPTRCDEQSHPDSCLSPLVAPQGDNEVIDGEISHVPSFGSLSEHRCVVPSEKYLPPELPGVNEYLNAMFNTEPEFTIDEKPFTFDFVGGPFSEFELDLKDGSRRFSHFPITYESLWDKTLKHRQMLWVTSEIDFTADLSQWKNHTGVNSIDDNTKYLIVCVLAFFHVSDGIVNENLITNMYKELTVPEARAFYCVQAYIESIHAEMYAISLDLFAPVSHKALIMNGLGNIPFVRLKGQWMEKYMHSGLPTSCRVFSFILVEGLFFSSSFCVLFWLKKRGLMPGLCLSNDYIARDEGMHVQFGMDVYSHFSNGRLTEEQAHSITKEAVGVELEYVKAILQKDLPSLNKRLMTQYVHYVADYLLVSVGYNKIYEVKNPFDWMTSISISGKSNFFEKKVSEYRSSVNISREPIGKEAFAKLISEDF